MNCVRIEAKSLKIFSCSFCSHLVELEGKQMSSWENCLHNWQWQRTTASPWLHNSISRFKLKFEEHLRNVWSVKNLSSLSKTCWVDMRIRSKDVNPAHHCLWVHFLAEFYFPNNVIMWKSPKFILKRYSSLHLDLLDVVLRLEYDNSVSFLYDVFRGVWKYIRAVRDF